MGSNVGFELTRLCTKRLIYGAGVDVREVKDNMCERKKPLLFWGRARSNVKVDEERLIVLAARA